MSELERWAFLKRAVETLSAAPRFRPVMSSRQLDALRAEFGVEAADLAISEFGIVVIDSDTPFSDAHNKAKP
jgi:hypothetical protein